MSTGRAFAIAFIVGILGTVACAALGLKEAEVHLVISADGGAREAGSR